ncbi:LCP family protein [Nocardioides cynanchi]|uniref:LCP family protein n=1 Tax=Nocardioides cynanchi TaxID=2558918 RepID=UPI001786018E|nr:LCP family protein [Nocardioides cynanchi]
MSASPPEPSTSADDSVAGKRKGKVKARHTVGRVVLATMTVIALATGVSVVYLYRHYNSNLTVLDTGAALKNRPKHVAPTGPSGPINILVMGSDNRDAPGDHIDNLTGIGKRSDTTILLHLSADRQHAYGISIPRDSVVHRAACYDTTGKQISAPTDGAMWNDAFNIGGPACTIEQFEQLTHVPVDHFVVVDFAGFQAMVDAIGGVDVCIPHAVNDTIGHITLPAGTHKLSGMQALDYVREREALGNGSDIGRIKRQQAFIASMAHTAISANTLANPLHLTRFLDATTKSLTVDTGLKSIAKLVGLAYQFRHIGLNKIQFVTTPWMADPTNANRVVWQTQPAAAMWNDIAHDRLLPKSILSGSINAKHIPGVTHNHKPGSSQAAANLANGLCA